MKNIYFFCMLFIFTAITNLCCTKPGESPQAGSESSASDRTIKIIEIIPDKLLSVPNDSFYVTVKGIELSNIPVYVHLDIKSHEDNSCTAFSPDSLLISKGSPTKTFIINTSNLNSSCVARNSVFRVVAWFNDTLNIPRRDSVYYQWGNLPTTGNTLTAQVEPWRMYYVSDLLADTLNNCIVRSFNPSDSNYIKCTVTFDNINHQSPDTNFLVGFENYSGLTSICDWWSQNHSSDPFKNKIVYARFNDVLPGLVGWSHTGYYPPNGTDDWSYVFYKNILDLCPTSGTRNDTTVGNLTAVHEIMHQLANSHGDRAHNVHNGYFAFKCALWQEDNHFTSELQNHRYTNKFRVCINHTMALRSFRQVIPLDNWEGNVIFTNYIAKDHFKRSASNVNNGDIYKITLSLPKQEYKKYEPVIAKVILVNNDIKPLDIYNLHTYISDEAKFTIRDQFGIIYDSKQLAGFFLSHYTTEILPGDSLVFSMPINNWGKATSYESTNSLDEVYFSQFGFFPVGRYTANFHCSPLRNNEEVYSNDITFIVTDLLQEDKDVLQIYKAEQYDEALFKYPNNIFAEHILRWKMLSHWSRITSNTENDYNDFIMKYPQSMYLYSWGFMLPYIKAAEQRMDSFEGVVDYLLNVQNQESLAKQSLSNKSFITIIKNYGKIIENNK